mmetsp:Transcript_16033/g.36968  ORF Transcript_16033/g.36968 Transcript_16033/m.36968 type:complete len:205 (-) Transcript_16033:536-1150(-)
MLLFPSPRHRPDVGRPLHDIGKVHRFVLVKGKPSLDPLVVDPNRLASVEDDHHAQQGGLPVQNQPYGNGDAPDRRGQSNGKDPKDGVPLLVESIGGRHHGSIRSAEGHTGSEDRQGGRLADDDHVGAKGCHDGDVVHEFHESHHHHQALAPCGSIRRIEFDEHGNVEPCQDGSDGSDRGHIGMVQIEFFFLQCRGLLLQRTLQL